MLCLFVAKNKNARHGRHTGRKSQEEPSVMVIAIALRRSD
jgi:hypothetical protein